MGLINLRNGGWTRDRRLDRIPQFDPRSMMQFAVAPLLDDAPPVSRRWECGYWLDQGREGACVGFGFAHELGAEPVAVDVQDAFARRIYTEAKKIDPWPGEDYEGTSVLAGAKVCQRLGYIVEYRWARGLEETLRAIAHLGPVVLGLNWYEGMGEPNAGGYIVPQGALRGGHCIVALGVDMQRSRVRLRNSWGREWGEDGECWIACRDLARLIEEGGDVCVPLQRAFAPAEPAPKRRPWWQRIFGETGNRSGRDAFACTQDACATP